MSTTPGLTVIVHTKNSAASLRSCLASVYGWVDEILVVDQGSTDDTLKIAKKFSAKVLSVPDTGYVEPARQPALDAVGTDWTLILDSDEEIPEALQKNIIRVLQNPPSEIIALARKNIIFGEWAQVGWWPDYQVRLFRTGTVRWPPELHAQPVLSGTAQQAPAEEGWAILHHNYADIDAFVQRALRYSSIAAKEVESGSRKTADHPLESFLEEFLRRYYSEKGSAEGSFGATLSVLQSFFEVLVLTKYWENKHFPQLKQPVSVSTILDRFAEDAFYWEMHERWLAAHGIRKLWYRVRMKFRV